MRRFLLVTFSAVSMVWASQARADLSWTWSYSSTGGGPSYSASGAFVTEDTPDANGFYLITAISGTADGAAITALTPPGTANPGNAPFAVDDLVSPVSGAQLTGHGFGFSIANGDYSNPFNNKGYLTYISVPPYVGGAGPEPPITFSATLPEPTSIGLLLAGLAGAMTVRLGRRS